jgi:hypothetical protein
MIAAKGIGIFLLDRIDPELPGPGPEIPDPIAGGAPAAAR